MKSYKSLKLTKGELLSCDDNHSWKIGKWYEENSTLNYSVGFHANENLINALRVGCGDVIALVECDGDHIASGDGQRWQRMRILEAYRWTRLDSVSLAIFCAEFVINLFEKRYPEDKRPRLAIDAARRYRYCFDASSVKSWKLPS